MKKLFFIAVCSMFVACSVNANKDNQLNTSAQTETGNVVKVTNKKSPTSVDYKLVKKTVLQDQGFDGYESIEIIEVEGHTIISHKWKRANAGGISDTHILGCYGCSVQ